MNAVGDSASGTTAISLGTTARRHGCGFAGSMTRLGLTRVPARLAAGFRSVGDMVGPDDAVGSGGEEDDCPGIALGDGDGGGFTEDDDSGFGSSDGFESPNRSCDGFGVPAGLRLLDEMRVCLG
jgi:hypothetical protein